MSKIHRFTKPRHVLIFWLMVDIVTSYVTVSVTPVRGDRCTNWGYRSITVSIPAPVFLRSNPEALLRSEKKTIEIGNIALSLFEIKVQNKLCRLEIHKIHGSIYRTNHVMSGALR